MPKVLRLFLVSHLLLASGCLLPYWVSPSLDFVLATRLNLVDGPVYAFRVDTSESTPYFPGWLLQTHQLTPITLDAEGDFPAQLRLSCTRGFLAFFVALNYCTWHQDTISVRLYRPGFQTVRLQSWHFSDKVIWKKAETLADQVQAVDDLVGGQVEAGGISPKHHEALLFAISEYERLASGIYGDDPQLSVQRQQTLDKAERLRQRAEEKYERGWMNRLIG